MDTKDIPTYPQPYQPHPVIRLHRHPADDEPQYLIDPDPVEEAVITETSTTLSVNGEDWLTFLCTPLNLDDLAVGFLYTQRVIQSLAEVENLHISENGSRVDVWLSHAAEKPRLWQKNSGCSGGISAADLRLVPLAAEILYTRSARSLFQVLADFHNAQQLYQASGGVHASALFCGDELKLSAEDIGRHNTLDKIAGQALRQGLCGGHRLLITTGRVSLEMLQKAAILAAPFVLSRTSPTSASIQLARELGITLIGYARANGMKIYTHAEWVSR
jgi:FdhD protein